MQFRKTGLYAAAVAFVAVLCVLALIAGEIAFRLIDGYAPLSFKLVQRSAPATAAAGTSHAASVPLAPGVRIEWFDRSPERPAPRPPDPVLVQATPDPQAIGIVADTARVFNWGYAGPSLCYDSRFERFPNVLFAYDAPNGAPAPPYRFARSAVYPGGLVTNAYGWRGPPIDFRKADRTIRIAFVGASTTIGNHQYPASYPELIGHWLNLWAADQNLGVRFEIINAGREGIASTHIAAVVRDEVLPMEPDLVVYYEGSNQFSPKGIVQDRTDDGRPTTAVLAPVPAADPQDALVRAAGYSAIMRRFQDLRWRLSEPAKPAYKVVWPRDVDEFDPPLAHPDLPADLTTILRDLDDMRTRVAGAGADFVLSSFFWLVFDGMTLHPVRNRGIYLYLNSTFHPYRYRDMERMARFQNRVFAKYARTHGVAFLDVAGRMPKEPDLFVDAIHGTYDGVRVHAWIATQQLVPLLRDRISQGRLPRAARTGLRAHPAFPGNERTITYDCRLDMSGATMMGRIGFDQGVEAVAPAKVETVPDLAVRIPGGLAPYHYAAMAPTPRTNSPLDHDWILDLEVAVTGGEAVIGIMSADRQRYLISKLIRGTDGFVPMKLVFPPAQSGLGPLMVAAGSIVPRDVTITVRNAKLWSLRNPRHIEVYATGLAVPSDRR
jgi:hypothetical protein